MKLTKAIIIAALFCITQLTSHAQDNNDKSEKSAEKENYIDSKHIFFIEVDPLPYILGGVGGHFGWAPKKNKHFALGVGFVAGLKFPEAFVNMNKENKGQGWSLKVNQGASIWGQYYFRKKNQGWFTGLQLITQELKLENDNYPGQYDRTNVVMFALQGGYVWYPFSKIGLYLRPWAGFAVQKPIKATFEPEKVNPEMTIGGKEYHLAPIQPFATLHIGYTFR